MSILQEFGFQLNELLTSVEKTMDCIEDCNHKASNIHERFTGSLNDSILLSIEEQRTLLEHSHEELARFHGMLTELIAATISLEEIQVLYGPPPSFDGDDGRKYRYL